MFGALWLVLVESSWEFLCPQYHNAVTRLGGIQKLSKAVVAIIGQKLQTLFGLVLPKGYQVNLGALHLVTPFDSRLLPITQSRKVGTPGCRWFSPMHRWSQGESGCAPGKAWASSGELRRSGTKFPHAPCWASFEPSVRLDPRRLGERAEGGQGAALGKRYAQSG